MKLLWHNLLFFSYTNINCYFSRPSELLIVHSPDYIIGNAPSMQLEKQQVSLFTKNETKMYLHIQRQAKNRIAVSGGSQSGNMGRKT